MLQQTFNGVNPVIKPLEATASSITPIDMTPTFTDVMELLLP